MKIEYEADQILKFWLIRCGPCGASFDQNFCEEFVVVNLEFVFHSFSEITMAIFC